MALKAALEDCEDPHPQYLTPNSEDRPPKTHTQKNGEACSCGPGDARVATGLTHDQLGNLGHSHNFRSELQVTGYS